MSEPDFAILYSLSSILSAAKDPGSRKSDPGSERYSIVYNLNRA